MAANFKLLSSKARRAFRSALSSVGRDIVELIRFEISVPVQGSGRDAIRSEPGEPPCYEFGSLSKAITYKVAPQASSLDALTVYCRILRGVWLEYGTRSIEPRPFFAPVRRKLPDLYREVKQRFKQNLQTGAEAEQDFTVDF